MLKFGITNGSLSPHSPDAATEALVARCAALAVEGVDFVLLREKQLPAGTLAALSRRLIAAAGPRTRVLVAQRLDVALATSAAGVHLSARPDELTVPQVRRLMPEAFISVSCHTLEAIERARDQAASAVLFGPVFGKTVDGVEVAGGVGLDRLRAACHLAGTMQVFALGGVHAHNAPSCVEAGAAGVAGIRMFFP